MKQLLTTLALSTMAFVAPVAHAAPVTFSAILNGANESPAVPSAGTGTAFVIFDLALHTMQVKVNFAGLTGTTTAAHIHCCTALPNLANAGVASEVPVFTGFPLGVSAGDYDFTFDMSLLASFNPAFVNNNGGTAAFAEAALFAGMQDERSYLNIHTTFRPGGEIRGFLQQEVPEPGSLALFALGLAGLVAVKRGRSALSSKSDALS